MQKLPHQLEVEKELKESHMVFLIKQFYEKNGEWPRAQDIPNIARTIQRNFGGLPHFRKKYNLGYENYTKGIYRSDETAKFNNRANELETNIYHLLVQKYGKISIHRECLVFAGRKIRADFLVYKDGVEYLMIDCFYPKDLYSFKGCLNQKINKYKELKNIKTVFLQLNPKITNEDLQKVVASKKDRIEENQVVMNLEEFNDIILHNESL